MELSFLESRLFGRTCYGYQRNKDGIVETVPEEESTIRVIFELYASGYKLVDIQQYLYDNKISSPSGKDVWTRDVINKVLNNIKYTYTIIDEDMYYRVSKMLTSNCRYNHERSR